MTIKAIITDIEGTTTSLSFVKEILFPYARANMSDYVRSHEADPQVKQLLGDVCRLMGWKSWLGLGGGNKTGRLIDQLIRWMDEDKKVTPLKSLQGLIWEKGYERGDFCGHIYPDVAENLRAWKACGLELYVYSSGSVHAQKLLFAHTDYGDLTPLFSGYFDTRIGGKKEPESYRKIADQLGYQGGRILFLSDIKEELDAAKLSGFQTIGLARDDASDSCREHPQVKSFDEISISL